MARKPRYRSSPAKLARPPLLRASGLAVALAICASNVVFAQTSRTNSTEIIILDGDTVQAGGVIYRLMGFDAPERGDRALCDKERDLGEKAFARLRALIASGVPTLRRVACGCATGTEGSQACNAARACAFLTIGGTDVGEVLIGEGFARPFVCADTSCPPRRTWC